VNLKSGGARCIALSVLSLIQGATPTKAQETGVVSTAAAQAAPTVFTQAAPTVPTQAAPTSPTAPTKKPAAGNRAKVDFYGIYRLRIEDWNWFPTPKANGAYTFETSVLKLGVNSVARLNDFTLELEQPTVLNLPHDAAGPGALGSLGYGGSYYAADRNQSGSLFIKQAFVRYKRLANNPNASLQIGRFAFSDGTETTPADPSVAYLKQTRINDRLISEAFTSNLGRSFDGARFSESKRLRDVTAVIASPTRGAYQLDGWDMLNDVQVGYLAATFTQTGKHDAAEGRLFNVYYVDGRPKTVKVDNRPTAARTADTRAIHMDVFGGNYVRAFDLGPGRLDGVFWGAGEIGDWGHLSQAAYAYDAELGYQFTHTAWKPWLRLGYSFYSGDGAAGDTTHGSYIPILTTAQRYAPFPFYTQANLKDLFGQVILRPNAKLNVRAEVHALKLANAQDLWYTGSGAYENLNFGYSGRPSGGHSNLGTLYDISTDYTVSRNLTITLFLGYAHGGDVQAATFASKDANYSYLQFLTRF
jgi:hypothetical protein